MKNTCAKTMLAGLFALGTLTLAAAIRAASPIVWDGGPECWQMKRHAEKMKEVAAGGAKVVFVGDSITHNWEKQGKEQWKKYFSTGERRALNLGFGGDRTEHVLWRIVEGGELDGYEAKCIVLMIGTNNTGHWPFEEEPPVDTILGVKEILRVIAEKQPKARVILTSIFPRGADESHQKRARNTVVNRELAKFADGRKVIWCDFSDKFLDAQGRLSRSLMPDLLHPNWLGYEIWASAVVPLVDRVLAAGEDDVIPSVWPSQPRGLVYGEPFAAQPRSGFPDFMWWGKGRPLEKRSEIAENGGAEYDIVMVGDSITHRWERDGGEGRELFAELKKTYRILNLGYGGDATGHLIWRLANGELEGYKAKLFQVMIGTNNSDGPEDVAAGVKRVLEIIREKHPESKIVLLPIFPRADNLKRHERNLKANAIIKGFADDETVEWLDFNDRFLGAEGKPTKEVMNDLLHPNENGYRIWMDAILPVFRKHCGK